MEACPESIQDVNVRYESALHIALNNSMFEAFKLVLDRLQRKTDEEANNWKKRVVNCRDLEGNTVLHISIFRNQVQVTESLVTYSKSNPRMLELNAMNEKNQRAMDIASLFHHQHIHRLLKQITTNDNDYPTQNSNENQNFKTEGSPTTNASNVEIFCSEKYLKFDFKKTSPQKTRTDLLVIAILMAAATYLAVLSPPGGADNETGIALLSKNDGRYIWFMLGNSGMFYMSMYIIKVLLYGYPYFWDLYLGIIAMESSYNAVTVSISPSGNMRLFFLLFGILMPIFIPIVAFLLRKSFRRHERRRLAYHCHTNA